MSGSRLPRLVVVVPTGCTSRVAPGPDVAVVDEMALVKCHGPAEVRAARGSRFVTISPVAPTESKPGYGPPLGADGVRLAVAAAEGMPVFALGGVTQGNARIFLDAGAYGVAVMGAVLRAEDPDDVVRRLVEAIS